MMRVYFAGKIGKNDWRHDLFPGLRSASSEVMEAEKLPTFVQPNAVAWKGISYSGPWFMGCDHGCYHGRSSHGTLGSIQSDGKWYGERGPLSFGPADVVKHCKQWIEDSDALFVWLDALDAYGTCAEIGYAAALGKPIWLYEPPTASEDAWFLRELATYYKQTSSHEEAFTHFLIANGESPGAENAFCDQIERHLQARGWKTMREVPVPGGRIDIVANRGPQQWVIEAKMAATTRAVGQALGQLLLYGHYRPEAQLFFACPDAVPEQIVGLLKSHGVEVFRQ